MAILQSCGWGRRQVAGAGEPENFIVALHDYLYLDNKSIQRPEQKT